MQTIARQIRRKNATFVDNKALQKPELVTLTRYQKRADWITRNADSGFNDGYLLLVEHQTRRNREIIEANKKAKLEKQTIKLKN